MKNIIIIITISLLSFCIDCQAEKSDLENEMSGQMSTSNKDGKSKYGRKLL